MMYNLAKMQPENVRGLQEKLLSTENIAGVWLHEMPLDERFPVAQAPDCKTVKDTIAHHRQHHNTSTLDSPCPDYIFVLDREDIAEHGILLVNVKFYDSADAVRMPLRHDTTLAIYAMIQITGDWVELRDQPADAEEARFRPVKKFVVYSLLPSSAKDFQGSNKTPFDAIMMLLDQGLFCEVQMEYNSDPETFTPGRDYYVPVLAHAQTLSHIKSNHRTLAAHHNYDPNTFIVLDSEWKEKGLLFVRAPTAAAAGITAEGDNDGETDGSDEFRHKGPKCGELLNWAWTGLMSWEEAKEEREVEWPEWARKWMA
ncbi:MAG: hypothetical protein Q9227_001675 [Pyrenula ochraceoflavens]